MWVWRCSWNINFYCGKSGQAVKDSDDIWLRFLVGIRKGAFNQSLWLYVFSGEEGLVKGENVPLRVQRVTGKKCFEFVFKRSQKTEISITKKHDILYLSRAQECGNEIRIQPSGVVVLSYFLFKNVPAPIMRLTPKEQEKLLLHAAGKLMSLGKDERRLCRTLYPYLLGENSFLFFLCTPACNSF